MIELSITTLSATIASPVTPVSDRPAGGFARALDALTDPPLGPPPTVAARQGNADGGKNLPATGGAPVAVVPEKLIATATKAVLLRHIATPKIDPAQIPASAIDAVVAGDAAARVAVPATDTNDHKTSDDETPSTMPVAVPAPLILIDPSRLPVPTGEVTRAVPNAVVGTNTIATSGAVPDAGATTAIGGLSQAAPDAVQPQLTNPRAPAAPDSTPAPTNMAAMAVPALAVPRVQPAGASSLPKGVELLDIGGDIALVTSSAPITPSAPRSLPVPASAQHFAIGAPVPESIILSPALVQPARQAFAAALAALSVRVSPRKDDPSDPLQQISGALGPTADTSIASAVAQAANGQGAALDMSQDRGLRGMIDHIETLRDDANARDTRIRLVPDALGSVDVAVRRDGDAVHVRFSSANEATRIVLNDAQPRLVQLAEASGLRIAGSSVDSGTGGGQPRNPVPTPTNHPNRALRIDAPGEGDTVTDQRLA